MNVNEQFDLRNDLAAPVPIPGTNYHVRRQARRAARRMILEAHGISIGENESARQIYLRLGLNVLTMWLHECAIVRRSLGWAVYADPGAQYELTNNVIGWQDL